MPERPRDVPVNIDNYILQLLRRGPNWTPTEEHGTDALFWEHLAFVRRMTEAGTFVVVGPVRDNDVLFGMAIVRAATREEAEAICSQDPAVRAGRYSVELHPASFAGLEGVQVRFAP